MAGKQQVFRVVLDVVYREESPPVDGGELGDYIDEQLNLAGAPGIVKGHRLFVATLERGEAESLDSQCDFALDHTARSKMN